MIVKIGTDTYHVSVVVLGSHHVHHSIHGNFLTQNIWSLADKLRYQIVNKHKLRLTDHLHTARKHLQHLGSRSLSKLQLPSFNQIFQFKNRKLEEMSSRLSRELQLEEELEVLPSLLEQGGRMLTSHIQSVLARPEVLQGVAERLWRGRSGDSDVRSDANSKPVLTMILEAGFAGTEHRVVTPDGYILTLHRLHTQTTQPGPVVFLQHGLFSSSADWVSIQVFEISE